MLRGIRICKRVPSEGVPSHDDLKHSTNLRRKAIVPLQDNLTVNPEREVTRQENTALANQVVAREVR